MTWQLPLSPSASCESRKGAGPQTRTVPSSEAEAMSPGMAGFQLTQFTVRVWPVSSAMGSSPRRSSKLYPRIRWWVSEASTALPSPRHHRHCTLTPSQESNKLPSRS
ncbi:hypothetical protein EYF80_028202 [Liparis tanakae]|uniref:Uncharacterized protein n=1 Tax=Liparis tanakae TaxID=230148 RepID=A0A4Z2H7V6_9TELE|nr:hypothetical protein EYF80_028202 [Liparis tanakae]